MFEYSVQRHGRGESDLAEGKLDCFERAVASLMDRRVSDCGNCDGMITPLTALQLHRAVGCLERTAPVVPFRPNTARLNECGEGR